MNDKIINIEDKQGPYRMVFDRILAMVPDRERDDKKLQRLLAFRLHRDGEGATIEFLVHKIRDMLRCAYAGSLYEFLKDDRMEKECLHDPGSDPPPTIA